MNKIFIGLMLSLTIAATTYAGAARIDIDGRRGGVSFRPGTAENGTLNVGEWLKEKRNQYLWTSFPATEDWQKGAFSFTPENDGIAALDIRGNYAKNPDDRVWIFVNAIEIEGSTLKNTALDENARGWYLEKNADGRQVEVMDVYKESGRSFRVNHDFPAYQRIRLKAGQPVTVRFWYRLAQ